MNNIYMHILNSILEQQNNNKIKVALINNTYLSDININSFKNSFDEDINFIYHKFSSDKLQTAYSPFFEIIKDVYYSEFSDSYSIDDFLCECNVYPVLKNIISSYLLDGYCSRDDIMILVGGINEYEEKRFIKSLADILCFIAKKYNMFILLDNLHYCGNSTVKLLLSMLNSYISDGKLVIVGIFNSTHTVPEYMQNDWSALINDCQTKELIFESSEVVVERVIQKNDVAKMYTFNPDTIENDVNELASMVFSLANEQAIYYLNYLYSYISNNTVKISDVVRNQIYFIYAYCNVCNHNYKQSLIIMDSLKLIMPPVNYESENILDEKYNLYMLYRLNYLYSVIEIYQKNIDLAVSYAKVCSKIAALVSKPKLEFKADTLIDFSVLYSYNLVPLNKNTTYIKNKVNEALEYDYINAAIVYLTLGYEIDAETLSQIDRGSSFTYFDTAARLAVSVDNIHLLKHMHDYKNMYSYHFECYNAAQKCTQLCNSYIKKYTDKFLESGYNYSLKEEYSHSFLISNQNIISYYNKYIENKSISRHIQDITLNKYYLSETSIILLDIAKDCMNNKCYDTAELYINTIITILSNIEQPYLFNATLGLLYSYGAFCCIKQNLLYKSYSYITKASIFFSNRLNNSDYPKMRDYTHIFYYYLAQSAISAFENNNDAAQEYLDKSFTMFKESPSSYLFDYDTLCIEQYSLYKKLGKDYDARDILLDCIDFYERNRMSQKIQQLEALVNNQYYNDYYCDYKLKGIYLEELVRASHEEKNESELQEEQKNSFFLSTWRKKLNDSSINIDFLDKSAISTLKSVFDMNYAIYINTEKETPLLLYQDTSSHEIPINDICDIINYVREKPEAIYITRLEKEFYSLQKLLKPFNANKIDILICVPVLKKNELSRICLMFHTVQSILSVNVNRPLQDKRVATIETALSFLLDTEKNISIQNEINDYKVLLELTKDFIKNSIKRSTSLIDEELPDNVRMELQSIINDGNNLLFRNE